LPEEADAFLPEQGSVISGGYHPIRLIDQDKASIRIVTCGLGKVNAAMAIGRYVDVDTTLVAMVGTCGKIGAIEGDCFWIDQAIQHDYGARQPGGFIHYRGGDWPMGEAGDVAFVAMHDPGSGLPHATIISGDVFLECPVSAASLAERLDAQLVDMEVAAVAQAAETLGLPWCAIKAVTDDADSESSGNFHANLAVAARKAAKAMERLLLGAA
jgi:adenosylhomocysteine nucleosidase